MWLHGGGFAGGSLEMPEADATARELCTRIGATIVSVDYRLVGPEVCFPVPHEDVLAAWRWAVQASPGLGIDLGRLALGGASAGGNLAAGAALALRDGNSSPPSVLLLVYPLLHYRLPPATSMPEDMASLAPVLRIAPGSAAAVNDRYLGGAPPTPYSFPALGALVGLPPTVILTAEYDDLRASGEVFADALQEAGVDVGLRREAGVVHGYLNISGLAGWERSICTLAAFLRSTSAAR